MYGGTTFFFFLNMVALLTSLSYFLLRYAWVKSQLCILNFILKANYGGGKSAFVTLTANVRRNFTFRHFRLPQLNLPFLEVNFTSCFDR